MPTGATKAPYKIQQRGQKFVVVNNGNEVKATFKNKPAALNYLRALYASVPGAPKAADRKKWTGTQKRAVKEKASLMTGCEWCEREFLSEAAFQVHVSAVHQEEAKTFSVKERKQAAADGHAMPDGSFPIKNVADLKNAMQAVGRAKNKKAAVAHIKKRANALKVGHMAKGLSADKADWDGDTTYDDRRRAVQEALSDQFSPEDSPSLPGMVQPSFYVYVFDMTDDWVIFEVEGPDADTYKVGYSVADDGTISFTGDPVEVQRKMTWIPAPPEAAALCAPCERSFLSLKTVAMHAATVHDMAQAVATNYFDTLPDWYTRYAPEWEGVVRKQVAVLDETGLTIVKDYPVLNPESQQATDPSGEINREDAASDARLITVRRRDI